MTEPRATLWQTSLGPPLRWVDNLWQIDVASLPILHGLSVLSRALAEMTMAQARSDRVDVTVERRLRPRENPELIATFGIEVVKVWAEHATIEALVDRQQVIEGRLRSLLGSLQRQRYREALLPQDGRAPQALVAEFVDDDIAAPGVEPNRQRYVLEHLVARQDSGRGGLRITIEDHGRRRLDVTALPHLKIDDVAERQFIAGSTRIATSWTEALRREAVRGRRSFVEQRDPHSHLFQQLDQAGLGSIQRVSVQWSEHVLPFLLENEPAVTQELLKRVLLSLEDRGLRRLLAEREVVRVDAGAVPVFLDTAQLGRVLEVSLGQRRPRADADDFLARMPLLSAVVAGQRDAQPLRSVPVFLIHHMTAEIVGVIAALRALGCRDLTCLFVSYAGEPPASYLDAVLDLPPDEFRAMALVNVPQRGMVEGLYRLSHQYSQLDERDQIAAAVRAATHYLEAMRAAALVPFLRMVERGAAAGRRCLLVEDGGYLAPVLQDALSRSASVAEFALQMGHRIVDGRALDHAIGRNLLGTVEHTRNGFDRLLEVQRRHGALALPAWSIAISQLKRAVESREVAASVLNAIEAVLHADGRVLSRRSWLVLGSRGAIGRQICRNLLARIDAPARDLAGVDLGCPGPCDQSGFAEGRTLAELPQGRWLDVDCVLGVTGDSVLQGSDVEQWLSRGHKQRLVLVSASTKKVEFRDVMVWFDALLHDPAPRLGGEQVAIEIEELIDPRTSRVYGHRWQFAFASGRAARTVVALANLTPINFLFYGVATEMIDEVLAQLLTVTLAAVRRADDPAVAGRLLAVDRDVDAHGAPLAGATDGRAAD